MNKRSNTDLEEDFDDFISSGEDWTPVCSVKKKTLRISQRVKKKSKTSTDDTSSSDSNECIKKKKNGCQKKNLPSKRIPQVGTIIAPSDFGIGSFVVLKKDLQVGDKNKQPCVWRIDGKALLQKYEPYNYEGKMLHKSTSIYTGWSPLEKDLYAPIGVQVQVVCGQDILVELNYDTLQNAIDSD